MTKALARHEAREARVIPIILSPTDLTGTPFAKLQALAKNAKPITRWTKREDAYYDVVETGQRSALFISRAGDQDGASAPTRHPHSPRPYRRGNWLPLVDLLLAKTLYSNSM